MTYNLVEHGDRLEKMAVDFVRSLFPHYELVWQTYIGNKGNDTMAIMTNYPYEEKRTHFAENSYTVLESMFLINQVINENIFEESINSFEKYIEFNKSFITVFALIGRLYDTAKKCSEILGYDNEEFVMSIHKFYEARSIVIHGKKVPLVFDDMGLVKIPYLKTSVIDGIAWDDKTSFWSQITLMQMDYAFDKFKDFFENLVRIINEEYARFYHEIIQDLKSSQSSLIFEYTDYGTTHFPDASGTTMASTSSASIYGYKGPITTKK